jgi:hypothetical protein
MHVDVRTGYGIARARAVQGFEFEQRLDTPRRIDQVAAAGLCIDGTLAAERGDRDYLDVNTRSSKAWHGLPPSTVYPDG